MKYNIGIVPPSKGKPVGNYCSMSGCGGEKENEPKVWPIEMTRGKPSVF